jgi:hypothetical protein
MVVKLAARRMCHKEGPDDGIHYAIMHFLNADRRSPGMYMTETQEAFAADIKAKYEAL